jgi:nucleoporin POM152
MRVNNGQITVTKPGHYELVSVSDAHCPGTVLEPSRAYDIEWITRPTLQLAPEAGRLVKNGSLVRSQICEGVDDTAGVVFSGEQYCRFPWV